MKHNIKTVGLNKIIRMTTIMMIMMTMLLQIIIIIKIIHVYRRAESTVR